MPETQLVVVTIDNPSEYWLFSRPKNLIVPFPCVVTFHELHQATELDGEKPFDNYFPESKFPGVIDALFEP